MKTGGVGLGEFEQLVLLAILRLGVDAYGMRIRREIEERAKRPTSIGALYLTLNRLEQKRFVKSVLGKPTAERGGRAKRYFSVTPTGTNALRNTIQALKAMAKDHFSFALAA